MLRPQFREEIKRWGYFILFLYLVLLGMSHFYVHDRFGPDRAGTNGDKQSVDLGGKRLSYLEWGGAKAELAPLILLHGSPSGGARDWKKFAPELAVNGRRVIAIDRWGYGASERRVDDYSFEADAKAVLGLLDALGIAQAHVAGWSYGGAPAILLGARGDGRILSTTLIAAMAIQEGEGSGSYTVEHWKYSALNLLVNWLPELVPHFGLLGPRSVRRAFARDFTDCDQRPLKGKLATMHTPMLIIHGKRDSFVPAWVAQEHHRLNPKSRLVILNGSHFFPFGLGRDENFEIAAKEVNEFLAAADRGPGEAARLYGVRNETSRENLAALWNGGPAMRGYKPWWMIVMGGLAIGFFIPRTGGVIMGLSGALLLVDPVTALAGVVLGAIIRRGESRTRFHKAVAVCAFGLLGAVVGAVLLPWF